MHFNAAIREYFVLDQLLWERKGELHPLFSESLVEWEDSNYTNEHCIAQEKISSVMRTS